MGRLAAVVALAAVIVAAVVLVLGKGDDGPGATGPAEAYAAAWTRGDDAAAGALTDAPGRATAALRASRAGLDGAKVKAGVTDVTEDGDRATAVVTARWEVPGFGTFAYDTKLRLRKVDDKWTIRWQPQAVHPALRADTRLGTQVDTPVRAPILDRRGHELIGNRSVVDVAVEVDKATDGTAAALASVLGDDVDARKLAASIRKAPAGHFLPVITLRTADFAPVADELRAIPGVALNTTTRPLAPTRDFGRAVLGSVGPVTAEQLEESDRPLLPGALIGQSGLAGAYDEQLAGTPTRKVVVRYTDEGTVTEDLVEHPGKAPKPLRTTLDRDVQRAAEGALGGVAGNAALVALEPSTGNVLAVANRPADSTYDRAIEGLYPPGSTFKVVTTAALLGGGLDVDKIVDCPPTIVVDGRTFKNFEGGAAGAVPFSTDFAQSCNTAFVSLADRMRPDTLTRTAKAFGLGRPIKPGLPAAEASVPPATGATSQAAMMIGQDRIVASPLNMAGVAGAVAAGHWQSPRLVAGAPRAALPPLENVGELRTLMRSVVTSGTGTALAGVPGQPAGKSGTAEYGGGDPPPTHAWFIAYRGDLAVAVLVEDGVSGGRVAAPVAADFFNAL